MSAKTHWKHASTLIIAARSFVDKSRLAKEASKINYLQHDICCDYKVLALMRSKQTSFMAGGYVFPGGAVDNADSSEDWLHLFHQFGFKKEDLPVVDAANSLGSILKNEPKESIPKSLSLRITAIRETFEECGILLCKNDLVHDRKTSTWSSFLAGHEIQEWQKKVQNNPSEFVNLCNQLRCYPDVWPLQMWSNWLTPTQHRSRFDTAFFIATVDQLPPVFIDNGEIIGFKWCSPTDLLNLCDQREIWLPPPQYYELARLKNFNSLDKLSQFAARKNTLRCDQWMPVQIKTPKCQISLLPGDYMYPPEPVYESGKQQELAHDMEESTDDDAPLHRMELRGQDQTRIILRNIKLKSNDVLPVVDE